MATMVPAMVTSVMPAMMTAETAETIAAMATMVPKAEANVWQSITVSIKAPGVAMAAVMSVTVSGLLHHRAVFDR